MMDDRPTVDWSIHERFPLDEVECKCGVIFYAYAKLITTSVRGVHLVSRIPCPGCGFDDRVLRVCSAPESVAITSQAAGG